jgi:hypothetical protein
VSTNQTVGARIDADTADSRFQSLEGRREMSTAATAVAAGGTRWRRFALAFGMSFGLIAAVLMLMAKGVLAAPITISGTTFTVSASSLTADKPDSGPAFIQYGSVDALNGNHDGSTGVVVTKLPAGGVLQDMKQVVWAPTGLGAINDNWKYLVVELSAKSAHAQGGLTVDATKLDGATATFNNIEIGVPLFPGGPFSQKADGVTITGLDQTAVYTQAGTFKLEDLHLSAYLSSTHP